MSAVLESEPKQGRLVSINLRKVPESLRFQFKALCAASELGMEEAVLRMIEEAVERGTLFVKGRS